LASDPAYSAVILAKPEVPGIEKVSGDTVDYLMLVKTKPGAQDNVRRELRRRIKASFEINKVEPGNPNRVYVMEAAKPN
jgi:small conductance mechanosensitive channel